MAAGDGAVSGEPELSNEDFLRERGHEWGWPGEPAEQGEAPAGESEPDEASEEDRVRAVAALVEAENELAPPQDVVDWLNGPPPPGQTDDAEAEVRRRFLEEHGDPELLARELAELMQARDDMGRKVAGTG